MWNKYFITLSIRERATTIISGPDSQYCERSRDSLTVREHSDGI